MVTGESDDQPTRPRGSMSREEADSLRLVLLRSLNSNQLLILSKAKGFRNITSLLESISRESSIPLSTLKLNARILRDISLIEFNNGSSAKLTPAGELVLTIIKGENYDQRK